MPRPAALHAVREREGNPQRTPIPDSVRLDPEAPPEPDWLEPFPRLPRVKKPGAPPSQPPRLEKGADPEERKAHQLARLGWLVELARWSDEMYAYEEHERLQGESERCRRIAHETWDAMVPVLDAQGLLATVDLYELRDHCVLQARIDQCERDTTLRGIYLVSDRGQVRNPATVMANQCREKDRPYLQDFGLSPAARDKLNPRKGPDDEEGLFG